MCELWEERPDTGELNYFQEVDSSTFMFEARDDVGKSDFYMLDFLKNGTIRKA